MCQILGDNRMPIKLLSVVLAFTIFSAGEVNGFIVILYNLEASLLTSAVIPIY